MEQGCRNEEWLAAYLDRTLGEEERREYETHLSRCPECLADLIAAKVELDELLLDLAREEAADDHIYAPASVASATRVKSQRVSIFAPFSASRAFVARTASSLAAVAASLALVGGFLLLVTSPSWDPDIITGRGNLTQILATMSPGDMLLASSPRSPSIQTVSFRGPGTHTARLFEQAERSLAGAADRYGNEPFLSTLLGDLYVANGQINMAEISYKRGLNVDDPDARVLNGLAVAAFRRGDIAQSRKYFNWALQCKRAPAAIYYNLAVLSKAAGETERCKQYLGMYLKKDSSSALAEQARRMLRE